MTGAGTRLSPLGGDDPGALGPYRLLGRLGSGGMGRIYLARARPGGPLVAVKTLLADGPVSGDDRRRFAREVTLAQRVDDRCTARVVDADPEAPTPWMAIEYIAAPSLAELVGTAGRLPASAIRWIAAGTAQALVALHGQGIVHRDVKPQNILLPLDGPRLIDFGISHAQDITRTTLTLGTIAFTSPEQARGEPSTARSDVYSLGATLFHLAVGRPPYPQGEDTLRLLARVSRGDLDLTGLPKELVPLVRPCLAVDPSARPRPADVLERFLAEARRLPTSHSGSRWLPPRWTELIAAYERRGEEWRRTLPAGPGAPAADDRTAPVPPPGPTRADTGQREGERARERQRQQAEARQREAERERERQRAEARQREAERERERQREAERARVSAGAAGGRAGGGPAPTTNPQPPPARGSAGGWFLALLALAAFLLFLFRDGIDPSGSTSATTGGTGGFASRPPTAYTGTTGPRTGTATTDTGPEGAGATDAGPETYAPRRPTPDATDLAFRAVRAGDCLDVHADGHGSWSRRVPLRVRCDTAGAYVRVTATGPAARCATGRGRGRWTHHADDGVTTVLCLSRRFRAGQCFTAEVDAGSKASANLMEVWDCASDMVPRGQTHILRITGYYRLPPDSRVDCGNGGARSWYWAVDDGRAVVCARAR
ncbi:serine/threonine-protein kinase [Streptomyces sp. DH12]|uniref:serine/threonine-protein kinase n=1 Tax=Streptomyces sp. DH12 TaxID=2857010 RepID=UPI001E56B83F|nr:serine/threonine-protein kinase [Streptomyces sp. DH12]